MDHRGEPISLRPPAIDDVEVLIRLEEFQGQGGEGARERVGDRISLGLTLGVDGFVEFCVVAGRQVVGAIQARSPKGAFPPGVCEIGITLLPSARGRGVGREAVAALTEQLLGEGWGRVQASTPCDNQAMRHVLNHTNYSFEGVLRAYAPGTDTRTDYAMYAAINNEAD